MPNLESAAGPIIRLIGLVIRAKLASLHHKLDLQEWILYLNRINKNRLLLHLAKIIRNKVQHQAKCSSNIIIQQTQQVQQINSNNNPQVNNRKPYPNSNPKPFNNYSSNNNITNNSNNKSISNNHNLTNKYTNKSQQLSIPFSSQNKFSIQLWATKITSLTIKMMDLTWIASQMRMIWEGCLNKLMTMNLDIICIILRARSTKFNSKIIL